MRIGTLVLVGIVASAVLLLGVGAVLVRSLGDVDRALQTDRTASDLTRAAFELSILTSEYLQHRGQRPRDQWERKHASLGGLLESWSTMAGPSRTWSASSASRR